MKRYFGLLVVMLLLILILPLAAQDDEPAQVRFADLLWDGAAVNIYIDDVAFVGDGDATTVLPPNTVSKQYARLTAGAHTFAIVPDGEALEAAILGPEEFTLEAGHNYLLAMMGNTAADDLHLTFIDETVGLEKIDFSMSAGTLFVNNLYGIPAMDFYFAGKLEIANLAYGDYLFWQDAPEGSGTIITVAGEPETIIFQYDEAVGSPPDYFALWTWEGTFPGTLWEDLGGIYDGRYAGGVIVSDGGEVSVGDEVTMNLDVGHRIQYLLTLPSDMTLDILLTEDDDTNVADPAIRVYTDAGELLGENDELTMTDNADGVFNAGLEGLTLEAGTYILEAASAADIYHGEYTLSLFEAK
jgi:hypothetical protein